MLKNDTNVQEPSRTKKDQSVGRATGPAQHRKTVADQRDGDSKSPKRMCQTGAADESQPAPVNPETARNNAGGHASGRRCRRGEYEGRTVGIVEDRTMEGVSVEESTTERKRGERRRGL